MLLRIIALIICLPFAAARADLFTKRDIDFSNYDVPLYQQIVDRIKAKIAPRLGKGPLKRDRYFMIPFAYEDKRNRPEFSHSFISVIRVFATNKPAKLTPGLPTREYEGWEFEAFTISWLPADFMENPNLCVFDGFGARLFPTQNKCPISPGKNFSLADTIKLAVNAKNAVCMWGPYEIAKPGFDLGVRRKKLLDSGKIKYRADDRLYRKANVAISCFHAMAGLEELYPNGGIFGTGFKMWGFNGTARVLIEYTGKARYRKLLMDPVDVKKDRFGWVYVRERNGRPRFDPLQVASAYHR
ncbi:MAG TPA: hypothetical protein VJ719_00450 [Chthoniobacterales bacterium]|nr:hypothetical protein [Chthoniobacterales bacterium]